VQHKYRQTVLIFPSAGQTCHSYCTFCFRWPQFVDMPGMKFATDQANRFWAYLAAHREVTDVLLTGGDPMVMAKPVLERYIEPVFSPQYDHITNIRIGTKALAYWPYRFTQDRDADDLLRMFERIVKAGKHLAIMAHFDHDQEMRTAEVQAAIQRIRATGAEIRTQAPVLRLINDSPSAWADMWRRQVRLGCIPYYMFMMRDTGPQRYFQVTLERAWDIYRYACQDLSGLGRTARGPTMATEPGKVVVDGVADVHGEKVFVLSFLQARNPDWAKRIFFARYDGDAVWLSDLRPAFGEEHFWFEDAGSPAMLLRDREAV